MQLNELCQLFDVYEIVENQMDIDGRDFYSFSKYFTDGKTKTNINSAGYIHISSVQNANYLMLIDTQHKIYLCIYKYIAQTKFKGIIREMNKLKKILSDLTEHNKEKEEKEHPTKDIHIEEGLVDINKFECTECASKEPLEFIRCKSNPEALQTICKSCKTEYIFVPSKYYKLSSKRIIYFKSEDTSRKINVKEHKQPGTSSISISKGVNATPVFEVGVNTACGKHKSAQPQTTIANTPAEHADAKTT